METDMSIYEYYAFMPLLLYGLAIGELLFRWRDYFNDERRYWPHVIIGIILLDFAFFNFFYLYRFIGFFTSDYLHFILQLIHPIVFFLIVSVYTPEKESIVKEYFHNRLGLLFVLLAIFVASNDLVGYAMSVFNIFRILSIVVFLLIAYTKKFWLIWIYIAVRLSISILDYILPIFEPLGTY